MSSSDLMISARGISKRYTIRHNASDHITVAELAMDRIKHPFHRTPKEEFWALREVNIDVHRGEVLGLIGRNGAGKSTLLKVLTRITEPTKGRIDLWGRVGSLLEVGTGFHPELTGRENIYLNGSILGMTRKEITGQFDAIVDFAGVERFLDTPVKRYSSGMYVRLAFAVVAHLETEILLVDEVLAVGDAEFQKKCLGKMHDVAVDGRTVVFVSHHMPSIASMCDTCAVMEDGVLTSFNNTSEAIAQYQRAPASTWKALSSRRSGTGEVRVIEVSCEPSYSSSATKRVHFETERVRGNDTPFYVSAHFVSLDGTVVAQCDSRLLGVWGSPAGRSSFELALRHPWLRPGEYRVDLFVCNAGIIDWVEDACRFEVGFELPYPVAISEEVLVHGEVLPDFAYRCADEPPLFDSASTDMVDVDQPRP